MFLHAISANIQNRIKLLVFYYDLRMLDQHDAMEEDGTATISPYQCVSTSSWIRFHPLLYRGLPAILVASCQASAHFR